MKKLAGMLLLTALTAAGAGLLLSGPWKIFDRMAARAGRYLAESARDNTGSEAMRRILEDTDTYPASLRESLSDNPELLPFAQGFGRAREDTGGKGGLRLSEKVQKCPLFLQWDSRWGYTPYGSSCLGLCGCGPTALSMVIYSLTRNEEALPGALAGQSDRENGYIEGQGTSWLFMRDAAREWGLESEAVWMSEETMRKILEEGGLIILSVGPGDFTSQGHFIVVRDCDGTGFYINDPNRRSTSCREKAWTYGELSSQALQMFWYRL